MDEDAKNDLRLILTKGDAKIWLRIFPDINYTQLGTKKIRNVKILLDVESPLKNLNRNPH